MSWLNHYEKQLRHNGCVLVRHNRHRVWRTPSGALVVLPSTPGDWRSERNTSALLRRLGIVI